MCIRDSGADKPFDIRMWCLGNAMDGPWQLGHKSAEDYGMLAASVAAGMRQIDPDVELVVCGSSAHGMPTFGKWEQHLSLIHISLTTCWPVTTPCCSPPARSRTSR